jgi:hypothetical protein
MKAKTDNGIFLMDPETDIYKLASTNFMLRESDEKVKNFGLRSGHMRSPRFRPRAHAVSLL